MLQIMLEASAQSIFKPLHQFSTMNRFGHSRWQTMHQHITASLISIIAFASISKEFCTTSTCLQFPCSTGILARNMFNLVDKFLNIICLNWRGKLISVGSDGANSMTGHLKGVVTRL